MSADQMRRMQLVRKVRQTAQMGGERLGGGCLTLTGHRRVEGGLENTNHNPPPPHMQQVMR